MRIEHKANQPDELRLLSDLLRPDGEGMRQRSWQTFVGRYERTIVVCLHKVLRRYGALHLRQEVDDLTADVWLALLRDGMRKLRQYDPSRGYRLSSFIGMVATNVAIDHLRARRATPEPLTHAALVADGAGGDDLLSARERLALAREALGRLSDDDRAFVLAMVVAERSPEELARALGLSTNTVYSRKHKIHAKLSRLVKGLQDPLAA